MAQYEMEDIDISEFQPTQRQLLAKIKLHQFVPQNIIGGLSPETIGNLRAYIFPISVEEIQEWHMDNRVFWFWFTIRNEQTVRLHSLKSMAADTIGAILRGDVADVKLAGVQLKAAQLMLDLRDKPDQVVTNNTMNISGNSHSLPRSLKKKSTIELQEELKRLDTDNAR